MSEDGQDADDAKGRPPEGGGPKGGAKDEGKDDGGREGKENRFSGAHAGPRDGAHGAGAVHAVRQARANYTTVHGSSTLVDSSRIDRVQVGDTHHYHYGPRTAPLVTGAVTTEELRRLRLVFAPPPEYPALLDHLRGRRVLALCGDPGSGRGCTAVSLLDEVAHGAVERMDPRTELSALSGDAIREGHGYALELAGGTGRPAELHLDRLGALLAERNAHLVLVVDAGDLGDALLRGRYGRLFLPPPPQEVLKRHVASLVKGEERRTHALGVAERDDVRGALGLTRLRPREAVALAGLLARHAGGDLDDAGLLAECTRFAPRQAALWFAGAGRGATLRAALPTLRPAALRLGLAVYDGAPFSVAAEAAEALTWELATTLAPGRTPGRPLFTEDLRARLTAARAGLGTGEVSLGDDQVPVRTVRFEGRGLPWAVLSHVWEEHHNARGPMCRWLNAQCDDPRPLAWVPAALAAGALATLDFPFAEAELLMPLAGSESGTQRLAAATALAQTARTPRLRPVVASLVRGWAEDGNELLRSTAALVHGYGTVAGSVARSLDALGPLSEPGDDAAPEAAWAQLQDVSYSVVRLAAGAEPDTVLRRLGQWLGDRRIGRRDLALLSIIQLTGSRTWQLWGLDEQPELEAHQNWPLTAALIAAGPERAPLLADLVWAGLDTARSRDALLVGFRSWMRRSARNAELLDALCAFLPLLVSGPADAARLRALVTRLARDPDEPIPPATVERLGAALGAGPGPRPGGRDTPAAPTPSTRRRESTV
ncbi:hypothetical protein [Streptomyces sp. MP131-18]|uniref:hypothetical protein n=1 Tax=Streptomyces sp. MP131-18 TaxID=1857892 RepID=UPI00097C54C1|nr:hypothetical protein [Streptomyces sp. MP131-18]ONK10693.1 hypothetical protein STBA_14160 [Streptomyces sp. MP131-18]